MVRSLRRDPHVDQCKANLPSDVIPPVHRFAVHIPRVIDRLRGPVPILILTEHIEFQLRAKIHAHLFFCRGLHRLLQHVAGVLLIGTSVRIADVAEHPHNAPVHRSPRHDGYCAHIRLQKEIGFFLRAESVDRRGVDGYAIFQRSRQLARHDRDVLLVPEYIKKCEADEFDVFLLHELHHIFICFHGCLPIRSGSSTESSAPPRPLCSRRSRML